jgi:hypothetical protein
MNKRSMLVSDAAKEFKVTSSKICNILRILGFSQASYPNYKISDLEYNLLKEVLLKTQPESNHTKIVHNTDLPVTSYQDYIIGQTRIDVLRNFRKYHSELSTKEKSIFRLQVIPLISENNYHYTQLIDEKFYLCLNNCNKNEANNLSEFFKIIYLKTLCQDIDQSFFENKKPQTNPLRYDAEIVMALIETHQKELTVRSSNALNRIKTEIKNNPGIILQYTDINSAKNIPQIGKRSVGEIVSFFENIIHKMVKISNDNSSHVYDFKFEQLILRLGLKLDTFDMNYYADIDYLTLFEIYLKKNTKKFHVDIFLEITKGIKTKVLSSKYQYTRERIHQIFHEIKLIIVRKHKEFYHKVKYFLPNLTNDWEKTKLLQPQEIISQYHSSLDISILWLMIYEDLSFKGKDTIYCSYALSSLMDVAGFIENLQRSNRRVHYNYSMPLSEAVLPYITPGINVSTFTDYLDTCKAELKQIILEKTGLKINTEDKILFFRNTKIKLYEILQEIIEKLGHPMHIDELAAATGKKSDSIRSILNNTKNIFIQTGASTYGLKKWETEKNMKGGRIIDLIHDYLSSKPEPSYLFQIEKHLKKYRNTNHRSINGIIKLSPKNMFLCFDNLFFGVTGVHDEYTKYKFKSVPTNWHKYLYKRYSGKKVGLQQFMQFEQKKYDILPFVLEAHIEKRTDDGTIKTDQDGWLTFKEYFPSPKDDHSS